MSSGNDADVVEKPLTPFLLFDDARPGTRPALLFEEPLDWIVVDADGDPADAAQRIEAALAQGHFVAGTLAYELGYLLEPALRPLLRRMTDRRMTDPQAPLVRLAVWRPPVMLAGGAVDAWLRERGGGSARLGDIRPAWSLARYEQAFAPVQALIAAGDVYQINLTFPLHFTLDGNAIDLYRQLRRRARSGHCACLITADEAVLSLSPELFFAIDGSAIRTRPMKGTAARGVDAAHDRAAARALTASEKQRAENLMIVDLLRNDLARVAEVGSVRVSDLFTVETYPSLLTMTSGIGARLRRGCRPLDVLRALFPCGSVSGAPKIRAMQIIAEVEDGPRGVYCGALGWFAPNGDAAFNVAIRTLHVRDRAGTMAVGSGIVFDSDARAEYEECLVKARFLADSDRPFGLIETLRWSPDQGFVRLERHLDRLRASAAHFLFDWDEAAVRAALAAAASGRQKGGPAGGGEGALRIRLVLWEDGRIETTATPLGAPQPVPLTFAVSALPVDRDDRLLHHKTTRREVYERALTEAHAATGCDEVVLVNRQGELTEGSRTNLFIARDGVLLTPPLACGVLPGCLRAELIDRADPPVLERVLSLADLHAADHVFFGNSVRGLQPGVPIGTPHGCCTPPDPRRHAAGEHAAGEHAAAPGETGPGETGPGETVPAETDGPRSGC